MGFTWIKRLALSMTTYLASITVILLLTDTSGIVSNRDILTDRRDERDTWRKTIINYNNKNNCRFIYAGNMILLLET